MSLNAVPEGVEGNVSVLMVIWKWLIFPWVFPVLNLPIMVPLAVLKPLQPLMVLIATGLFYLYEPLAFVFVGLIAIWGIATIAFPDVKAPYHTFSDNLAFLTWSTGWVGCFLLALVYFPSFNGVLRWFAAATVGYYAGTVIMSYGGLIATGGKTELERTMDSIRAKAKEEID